MDGVSVAPCSACGQVVSVGAKFCSHCGFAVAAGTPSASRINKWYYNSWFILAMLAFVLGPFGLPLVWKHPRWSRSVKTLLTLGTLAYTAWLAMATLQMVRAVLQSVDAVNSTIGW